MKLHPNNPDRARKVLDQVYDERARQDAKWGEQSHDPRMWLAILVEEVGKAAKETLGDCSTGSVASNRLYLELTQIAAVAVAWLEHIRREENKPNA
jgi:hypothetical protein